MKRGIIALLLVGLTMAGCSGTADDTPVSSTTTATTTTTTTAPTTTAAAPTTEAPVETTEAPQPVWPSPVSYQAAIYDPVSDSILLAGGIRGDASGMGWSETSEVWELDVATATFQSRAPIPFRFLVVVPVAYDQESDTIVAVQTAMLNRWLAGTWTYDRTTDSWSETGSDQQPTVGLGTMMAYDAESDLIVAYGGYLVEAETYTDNTWVYDANTNTWTDMAPEFHPVGFEYCSFVYDEQSDLIVLYGTSDMIAKLGLEHTDYRSLWTYDVDTNTWTELDITGGPAVPPAYLKGFYHPPTDRIIYFGGLDPDVRAGEEAYNEVWAYDVDSNTWTELAPNPITGLIFHTFTYVPTLDRAIVFGGGPIYDDEPEGDRLLIYDPVADTWEEVLPPS